ncbi:UDP-glucuronic acid decarboxylase family protein [Candidatus Dependentiae bacterium]
MKHLKTILVTTLISLSTTSSPLARIKKTPQEHKTVLVTGGTGFLGSHLCEKLLSLGNNVIALDSLITSKLENVKHLLENPNFTFINHDIIYPIDLEVDWIFNFACPASPPLYQDDPIHTLKTSVIGGLNMLELARKNNARIMQASTSEIYGEPKEHPQKESYWGNVNTIGIRSCYDEGKRAAETLFFDYHRQYNLDIKVIRIFNTYGPRMNKYDGRVVSNFLNKALENKDLEVYGDGSQTRSFCYVDDLIEGIVTMMKTPQGITGPVNLGNPTEITILDLAKIVIKTTNSNSKIVFKPLPKDDPTRRKPDITLAKKLLDWEPTINLEKGLEKYIDFVKNS